VVTVTGGPGSPTDWVGLYQQGAADPAYFPNWQYLNGTKTPPSPGLTSAALTFTMPTSPGMYEFRFFANDGFTRLATSRAVTVNAAAPTLTVNVTAVNAGGSVMVTVTGGPGSPTDWVGLYQQGAADPAYFPNWQYLNGTKTPPSPGLTSAPFTFTMPTSPGMYEFRFFAN